MPTSDEDVINTQLLDTDNTGLMIAQDILVTAAVTGLVQDAAEDAIYHFGGKQSLKGLSRMAGTYVTKETAERIEKMTLTNLANKATQNLTRIFSGKSAAKVAETTGKAAAKQGAVLAGKAVGKEAAEKAALQVAKAGGKAVGKQVGQAAIRAAAVTAGGCALGPAGCLAGSVISMTMFIADMAFTVYSTILDIQDSQGFMIIWHKDFVDKVSGDFKIALEEGYEKLGMGGIMDEEIMFYPEMFIYDFDENNIPYMKDDNEWAIKYTQYFDEYMKNTAGIADGWRDRLDSQQLKPKDTLKPGGKDVPIIDSRKKTATKVIGIGIGVFVLLIIFILIVVGIRSG